MSTSRAGRLAAALLFGVALGYCLHRPAPSPARAAAAPTVPATIRVVRPTTRDETGAWRTEAKDLTVLLARDPAGTLTRYYDRGHPADAAVWAFTLDGETVLTAAEVP